MNHWYETVLMISSITHPELEYLGFKRIMPAPSLREFVQCFWTIHCGNLVVSQQKSFLYPDGGVSIVFNLKGSMLFNGKEIKPRFYLDCHNRMAKQVEFFGESDVIGIRFWPGGVSPFLSLAVHELTDDLIALEKIGLNLDHQLLEQLHLERSLTNRMLILERWLINRLHISKQGKLISQPAIQVLQQFSGNLSIDRLSDIVNMNRRRLERAFRKELGLSPKHFARLLKVEKARNLLKFHPEQSYSNVAYEAGFYDQAHFINEFKSIIKNTPKDYRTRKNTIFSNGIRLD